MTTDEVSQDRAHRPVDERRRTEVLLLVSSLVALAVSALPVRHDTIPGPELSVFRWINDLPGLLYEPVAAVMQLGNIAMIVPVAVVALLLRRYRLAIGLTVAAVGAYFLAKLVKRAADRGRPTDLLDGVHERGAHAAGLGYVSGHAAVVFAVVTVATMWFGRTARLVLWGLAVAVAVARVYVGAHLPLDVIGGAALGIAVGAAVRLAIGARRHGAQRTRSDAPDGGVPRP